MNERATLCLVLACWARTAGLTREEATQLAGLLSVEDLPLTVDAAWTQLDRVTMDIRRGRHQPPLQQQPPPWRDQ